MMGAQCLKFKKKKEHELPRAPNEQGEPQLKRIWPAMAVSSTTVIVMHSWALFKIKKRVAG
jgi:hypothetical protein